MTLSDIAIAVKASTVAAALAKQQTDPAGFRSDVLTFLRNRFPGVTITAADLSLKKIIIVIDPNSGYVGFGRGIGDALAAITKATTP